MKVLVTRPIDEAKATAARLGALGHGPLVEPLLRIAFTGAALPPGPFDAAVVTSSNAVAAIAARPADRFVLDLPMLAVGRRTAAAARQAGFASVDVAGRDVAGLLEAVRARWPGPRRILYLAGEDRTADLGALLAPLGHDVVVSVVYDAVREDRFTQGTQEALMSGEVGAVLHYSARTAQAYVECSRGIVSPVKPDLLHLCLSRRVGDVLRSAGAARVLVAERPEEEALLVLIPR